MNIIKGDLIKASLSSEDPVNVIIHGCNAQGVMGSGFAKQLKGVFPENFKGYKEFCEDTSPSPGAVFVDEEKGVTICNAITQKSFGRDGKLYVSYDGLDSCFDDIGEFFRMLGDSNDVIGYPMIGAGLGCGDWNIIKEIIDHRLKCLNHNLYIL